MKTYTALAGFATVTSAQFTEEYAESQATAMVNQEDLADDGLITLSMPQGSGQDHLLWSW